MVTGKGLMYGAVNRRNLLTWLIAVALVTVAVVFLTRGEWDMAESGPVTETTPADSDEDEFSPFQAKAQQLPEGAPSYIAFIAHGQEASRIGITELATGETHFLPALDVVPSDLQWSPDGHMLLFRADNDLMMFDFESRTMQTVTTGLSELDMPYAFSPDGQFIAVSLERELVVLQANKSGSANVHEYAYPEKGLFQQLLWSDDSSILLVLGLSEQQQQTWLGQITIHDWQVRHTRHTGVVELLGWDRQLNGLVTAMIDPERDGNRAAVMIPGQQDRYLYETAEHEDGEEVLLFNTSSRETLVQLMVEDPGDPVRLLVHPVGDTEPAPWLQDFPMLAGLQLLRGGKWATFVDTSPLLDSGDPGGDIYVVLWLGKKPLLILKSDPDKLAFDMPTLR